MHVTWIWEEQYGEKQTKFQKWLPLQMIVKNGMVSEN